MLDAVVAAAFEQVGEADDVGLHVGVRILQRVAHAGLRGEVDDGVEVALLEQVLHHHAVGDVVLEEAEVGVGLELFQPRQLQGRVVVVVEVVDADDFVAALQQDLCDVHADKPGGAGEQDFHCFASRSGVDSSTALGLGRSRCPAYNPVMPTLRLILDWSLYRLALLLAAPLIPLRLLWRGRRERGYLATLGRAAGRGHGAGWRAVDPCGVGRRDARGATA